MEGAPPRPRKKDQESISDAASVALGVWGATQSCRAGGGAISKTDPQRRNQWAAWKG